MNFVRVAVALIFFLGALSFCLCGRIGLFERKAETELASNSETSLMNGDDPDLEFAMETLRLRGEPAADIDLAKLASDFRFVDLYEPGEDAIWLDPLADSSDDQLDSNTKLTLAFEEIYRKWPELQTMEQERWNRELMSPGDRSQSQLAASESAKDQEKEKDSAFRQVGFPRTERDEKGKPSSTSDDQ